MSFDVAAESYGRFMGRFAEPLAERFVAWAGVRPGDRVLDVGCGPGALTARLVDLLGSDAVAAADPSEPFVRALAERLPGVDVRRAGAEALPFADATFDRAVAQLVVQFLDDPVAGLAEMARVTRPGGGVAACVWDAAGGSGPLAVFWRAARELDPGARDESSRPGAREGHLAELLRTAGLRAVTAGELVVSQAFASVEEWWAPYTLGVGPPGAYVRALAPDRVEALRQRCAALLPPPPFEISARAWIARGTVG